MGILLLVGYLGFAYFATHNGDFYHNRRWKAAIWFSAVPTSLGASILVYFSVASSLNVLGSKSALEIAGVIVMAVMSTLVLAVPFLFFVTWGMHHQLKWWFNSDDYLDKIWKDPNRGHKSPIQEL